jgi:hypothetical protein
MQKAIIVSGTVIQKVRATPYNVADQSEGHRRPRPLTAPCFGVAFVVTLMGMESPDTRRKADDSYRARSAGRSMCVTGLVALTEGDQWQDFQHLYR